MNKSKREEESEQVNGAACHQELEHAKRSEIVKERKQKKKRAEGM